MIVLRSQTGLHMNIDVTRVRSFSHTAFRASHAARARTSVAGMVALAALAVALTVLGVVVLGATFVGAWWLLSHIPVPTILTRAFRQA
jgi:hypothetical protein